MGGDIAPYWEARRTLPKPDTEDGWLGTQRQSEQQLRLFPVTPHGPLGQTQ